jgi:hypothetical protein
MKKMKIGPMLNKVVTVLTGIYFKQYNIVEKDKVLASTLWLNWNKAK